MSEKHFFHKHIYLILSFLFPFSILGIVYIIFNVYPFGDHQILVFDFWQQYYPFLSDYWHKIREGTSLLWSWTAGGGEYLPLISYYMASPLNFLAVLFPHALLREAVTLILLFKIGLAGFFFAIYLKCTYKRYDFSLPVAASFYALCAYTLGYYWNIMWFDTFALFPLVVLGVQSLVNEGKFRLFVISLALSIFTNYYIGFFTCIFVVIMFFSQCFLQKTGWRDFIHKLVLISACSVIAAGITAVITIPAYSSLQNSYSAQSVFPKTFIFYNSFIDILGNLIAFTPPTVTDGLPNLYCGMLTVMLAAVFIASPKVDLKEKLVFSGIVIFLLLSCNINVLYYIWNGFHFTNMLPFRFSFMVSFVLLVMAYKAFVLMEDIKRRDLIVMGMAAGFVLLMALTGRQKLVYVLGSAAVAVVYIIIFAFSIEKNASIKRRLNIAFLVVILTEISVTTFCGVKATRVTDRAVYPNSYNQVRQLLDMRQTAGPGFYRTEFTKWYSINDPSLYGYNGISMFASTANVSVTKFLEGLGLPAWQSGNRYYYAETSPLTNAFLNIRYLINRSGDPADKEVFWKPVGKSLDKSMLLENSRYLPLGFMVNKEISAYVHSNGNPFLSQNNLFRRATGLDGDLFTIIDMTHVEHKNYRVTRQASGQYIYRLNEKKDKGNLKWNYKIPENASLYAYCGIENSQKAYISANGNTSLPVEIKRPYISALGSFSKGDIISIMSDISAKSGKVNIYVAYINKELFELGYKKLADEMLSLTEFSETRIAGTITALQDGLLYTSIPCEERWEAFVDGVRTKIQLIDGTMAALSLTKGTHEIVFRYKNNNLIIGAGISMVSLLAFAVIIMLDTRRRVKNTKNLYRTKLY